MPDKQQLLKKLLNCIDVRLFGVTFAPSEEKKNVSLTGSVQISYGLNKFSEDIHYTNQILSPYQPKGTGQTTIGEESKGLESHYVFDFVVNPNHLKDGVEHLGVDEGALLGKKDINSFKEAARKGVSSVNSTTKIGSENELLLYIEYSQPLLLQNLKDFVKITASDDKVKRTIDLSDLEGYLIGEQGIFSKEDESKAKIEIYYEPQKTIIIGFDDTSDKAKIKKYHLITGKEIADNQK